MVLSISTVEGNGQIYFWLGLGLGQGDNYGYISSVSTVEGYWWVYFLFYNLIKLNI